MRGEDDDCLGFDLLDDFFADGLQDRVDGVFGVVLDVGLGTVLVDDGRWFPGYAYV